MPGRPHPGRALGDETSRDLRHSSQLCLRAARCPPTCGGKLGNRSENNAGSRAKPAFKGRERGNPGDPPREVFFNLGKKTKICLVVLPIDGGMMSIRAKAGLLPGP